MKQTDFTGSRATLIANIGAVVLAFMILIEAAIIVWRSFGYLATGAGALICFLPVAGMFIIRSEPFSFAFLFAHFVLVVRLGFAIYNVETISKGNNPLFMIVLFGMATVVCLVAYLGISLVRTAASAVRKK